MDGVWRTINGVHVLIGKDGSILKGPKKLQKTDIQKRLKKQFENNDKKTELENKKQDLNEKLDNLNFEELNELFNKTQDFEIRQTIMDKMQEKDVVRFGKEIMGLDMKDIDYKGTFDDAIKKANTFNKDKPFITEKVYHGTNAKFEKFNYDHFGQTDKGDFGQGIYTTKDKSIASKYGSNVKEVEVKYKNPLRISNQKDFEKHFEQYGDKYGEAKSLYNSKQIAVSIMNMGYDAVIDDVYGQVIVYDLKNINIKK